FFFSSRGRHTRWPRDWSSDVCSSDLAIWPRSIGPSAALALLQSAQVEPSPGPMLRGQIARLSALLPEFDKPVHLSLLSDSLTQEIGRASCRERVENSGAAGPAQRRRD